jgi:hypothetical protein
MAPSTLPLLIFSVLIFLQKANSNNPCLRNKLEVRFPFGFDNNKCSYPGFNLSCNDLQNQIILNLPNTGNFTVQNINYRSQTVTITDPQNCLPKKFMNSSFELSGSPFIPEHYNRSFTFLNCSSNSTTAVSGLRRINCLSNENFIVVAMLTTKYESLPYNMPAPSCKELKKRVFVPVLWSDSEAKLKWNASYCRRCEEDGGTCGFKGDTCLTIECKGRRSNGMFFEQF